MPTLTEPFPTRELTGVAGARVWCVDLDQPPQVIDQMMAILAPAERQRAASLHGAPARRRFVVGRATLRIILGELTGTTPVQVSFSYGPYGKPSLMVQSSPAPLHFNLSQSRDVAVLAVAGSGPVGVDVEWTEGSTPVDGVARRFLSPAERTSLNAAPAADRRRRLFRIWVRKEAYLKGRGEGISERIFETNFSSLDAPDRHLPGQPARDQDAWLVHDLGGLPSGYVGSVALARDTS